MNKLQNLYEITKFIEIKKHSMKFLKNVHL